MLFSTGASANIDDLDAMIKFLMVNGVMVVLVVLVVESEFRDMFVFSYLIGVLMFIDVFIEFTA